MNHLYNLNSAKLILLLGGLLCSTLTAAAYYDPGVQRWINRDPYDEPGFEALRKYEGTHSSTGPNSFQYVRNSPVIWVDPLGLRKFKGCSPAQITEINKGLNDKCAAAKSAGCFKCLSNNKQKAMNGLCDDTSKGLDEVTFVCDTTTSSPDCATTPGGLIPIGGSAPGSRVSHLCFPAASSPRGGGVGCAALHEAAHSVGGVGDDQDPTAKSYDSRAYDIGQCAGCPRPTGF